MNLTDEERIRCVECSKRLFQTKLFCIQSIQYLIEQQREIDECIDDLKQTKIHAQQINRKISDLNDISWLRICCLNTKQSSFEMNANDQNQLLILPFQNEQISKATSIYGLNELEKDFKLEDLILSMKNVDLEFTNKEDFERSLHEDYSILFELAKKLTKCVQILHDTIEFLGTDIKLTLDHMQLAQPRMRQLLRLKVPLAFEQVQNESMI